jgi:putative acetyltransferase
MISLRPAHPDDTEAIGRLFSASRRLLTFLPELHTVDEDMAFIAEHILPSHLVTVALLDGEIAGYMAERPEWIEQLYMRPDIRRSGVGSALMAVAKLRHPAIELWCFKQNIAGRAFYEKHGFVPLHETDGAENEARAPDVRYRWER